MYVPTLSLRLQGFLIGSVAIASVSVSVVALGSGTESRKLSGGILLLAGLALAWAARQVQAPLLTSFPFWRRLFVGIVAAYVLAIVTVGGSDAARWWFLALAACWLSFLISRPTAGDRRRTSCRLARGLEIGATNLALTLVLGELALRAFGAWSGHALLLDPTLNAYRLEPNRNYADLLFTNSHGYASREFHVQKRPGVHRIAALGDSFAVGVVRQDQNFLSLLEGLLPDTEVYNFGIAGIAPREYDAILRSEVWQFQPDLVLVCFFVGNDVLGWWRQPSSSQLDPNSYRWRVLAERSWRLWRESQRRQNELDPGERIRQPLDRPPLARVTHLEHEVSRLAICQRSEAARVERSWTRTFKYLDRIIAQCRDRDVPLAVVLIPDEAQVNPELLREMMEFGPIPREDLDLNAPQRQLRAYFAEHRVPCLDLLPVFAGVSNTYKPRDTHWNEKGNRLAAEALADWLQRVQHEQQPRSHVGRI